MGKKKEIIGICKICKEEKKLTYEHFPPKSAFNNNTKFYRIKSADYFDNFYEYIETKKVKAKVEQGGLGDYCLCEQCNNFLGRNYVNDYIAFAKICYGLLQHYDIIKSVHFKLKKEEVNLKYFLKQATAIFICNNKDWFTDSYPELLAFVKNKELSNLSENFRFYLYLNEEGQLRNGNWNMTNIYGETCEFTFPPFGIILSINNSIRIDEALEITSFKNYDLISEKEFDIILNKYPTFSPIPLDFRTKEEILERKHKY